MTALGVPSLNLMPAARVVSARRSQRLRAWAGALAIYTAAAAGVWAWFTFASVAAEDVSAELAAAEARLQTLKSERRVVNARLANARREAEARHEVHFHPDFSTLLRRVATACGQTVTLEKLSMLPLEKRDDKGVKSDLAANAGYKLQLSGLAATQADIPRFARELENLGIFESVSVQSIRAREAPFIEREDGTKIPQPQLFFFEVEGIMSDVGAGGAR
ncbi:MAG TPA: PilN domain-containing protein [Phycisphaerales bacterium]|nr:PilN domain-containing protein [Phycisphaerales bacterium]